MSLSLRMQQSFVAIVLVLHVLWLVNHLRWVATDQVNPWKLGGYGMYTVPSPEVRLDIRAVSPSGRIWVLDPASYSLTAFQRSFAHTNADRVFRCAPVESGHLRAFFDENPQFRGADLTFVFSERQFSRDPVAADRGEQGRVEVKWIGYSNLVYGSLFCGKMEIGEMSLP